MWRGTKCLLSAVAVISQEAAGWVFSMPRQEGERRLLQSGNKCPCSLMLVLALCSLQQLLSSSAGRGWWPTAFPLPSNAGIQPTRSVRCSLLLGKLCCRAEEASPGGDLPALAARRECFPPRPPLPVPPEGCWCFSSDHPLGQVWLLHVLSYIISGGGTWEDRASSQVPPATPSVQTFSHQHAWFWDPAPGGNRAATLRLP